MKNLSLEGFDVQNEHSVNIERVIKFHACISAPDFNSFRQAITCWCQSGFKQKNIFLDHWDNSLISSLLTEMQTYMLSFHDVQWSKRKEKMLGYFTINNTLRADSQEWLAMLKCWSSWWAFKTTPKYYFISDFIDNFAKSEFFLKDNFKKSLWFKSQLKSMQVLLVYIVIKACSLNI